VKDAKVKVDSIVTGLTRNTKVSLSAKDKTIAEILDELGKKYGLGYIILGKDDLKGKYEPARKRTTRCC